MSQKKTEKIACPYCGHEQEFQSWETVNFDSEPGLKEKIMNEELFTFTCEDCGKKAIIAFPCLFNDMNKKYLIWLIGDFSEEDKEALDKDLMDSLKGDEEKEFAASYTKRIAGTVNELKEKILLADEGLDDRIMEVLKTLCINEVIDQIMAYTLREVRYNRGEDGKMYLILIFDEKEPSMIEINMDMYDKVKDMFMEDIEAATPKDGFAVIDPFWAKYVVEKDEYEN